MGAPSASDSTSGLIPSFFAGSSASSRQTVAGAQPDVNCPRVEVRIGASTLTIGPTGDKAAMSLKYQGTFSRAARECAVVDGNMVMKIGVQGRVIVGPAGGPGQVDVPLRFAVVQETPGGSTPIATKFIRLPVMIGPNDGNVPFTHIEDAISFPLPAPMTLLDDYVAYVGFDPLSAEAQDQQKEKPKPKPKRKPKPAASAN
ncbi:MAG: hypothetical protein ABSA90_17705 [Xanthobacteraceae bacterium]